MRRTSSRVGAALLLAGVTLLPADALAGTAASSPAAATSSPSASPTTTTSPAAKPTTSSKPPAPGASRPARTRPPTPAPAPVPASGSPSASPSPSSTIDFARLELERQAQQAQARLLAAATDYQHARSTITQAEVAASQAGLDAQVAERRARRARAVLAAHAGHIYRQGMPDSLAVWLSSDPGNVAEIARGAYYNDRIAVDNEERLRTAVADVEAAKKARAQARRAQAAADAAVRSASASLAVISARAEAIAADFNEDILLVARQRAEAAAAARRANDAAARRWSGYLAQLDDAELVPPPAELLADPDRLPEGLVPLRDGRGTPIPGVAATTVAGRGVTVLPAETVQAVSSAIGALGTPYLPEATGPEFYDCGRLTARVWRVSGLELPARPADQAGLVRPVPADTAQVGDLVFVADRTGTHDVGIYLGGDQVLGASAAAGQVQVSPLPTDSEVTFGRATLPGPPEAQAVRSAPRMRCGAPDLVTPGDGSWGGFPNGMIPAAALCSVPTSPGHLLRCDAARGVQALAAAYLGRFRTPLCITDSYRSIAGQIAVFAAKPDLAAVPGTSQHGWGLALDLCGGIQQFGTPQHEWMRANAPRFGWMHPSWAETRGSKPEPWHWEFAGRALPPGR